MRLASRLAMSAGANNSPSDDGVSQSPHILVKGWA
jgi:hypothetical protein